MELGGENNGARARRAGVPAGRCPPEPPPAPAEGTAQSARNATTSISTRAAAGRSFTATVLRAGGLPPNWAA